MSQAQTFDCIVLGLGGMGSAAAAQLAARGARVLGLEQYGPAHARGSSHGETRIIRKAYFEHPDYVPLLERAYQLWAELEQAVATALIVRTGLLLAGAPSGAVVTGVRRARDIHRLRIDELDADERRRRFPDFFIADENAALFEADAGYLAVERCVQAALTRAARDGADLRFDEAALEWSAAASDVRVRTARGTYAAARLVICGGAWAGALLAREGLPLRVLRKMQLWFGCDEGVLDPARGAPAFCYETPAGFYYGFPAIEPGVVKIARHDGGAVVADPAQLDGVLHPEDVAPVRRFLERHLPAVRPTPLRHSACMYTMTPDQHFIIDRVRDAPQVLYAAGFSGHGFKFCPVIGAALADLAMMGATALPIDFLRAVRFS